MRRTKVIIPLMMIMLAMAVSGCSSESSADGEANVGSTENSEDSIGNIAEYEDTTAELLDAEFFESDDGTSMVRVYVEYTNAGSDGMYMLESFSVKAFQNDTELTDSTDINDDESSMCLIQEVKDGESVQGSYVFELSDDSDVEVRICTPTADEDLLAMQIYSK